MLSVLCCGCLATTPYKRCSVLGVYYVTATIRFTVDDGSTAEGHIIAFNKPAVSSLLVLKKGDSIAITGKAKLSVWGKETNLRLSIVTDKVLSLPSPEKEQLRSDA